MGIVLLDGMEDSVLWVAGGAPTFVAGRNGNCTNFPSGNISTYTIPAALESDTVTVGCAFRFSALPPANVAPIYLKSDAGATSHIVVSITNLGAITAGRTSNVLGTTITNLVAPNIWYYLEVQAKLHDTTGFITVRVSGVTVLNLTGQDTKNAGTKTTIDTVQIGSQTSAGGGSGVISLIDDLYVEAGASDPFLGDIVVETLYPNGNGNANTWLGSDADSVNNYLLVDEVGGPVTSDYVADSVSGHQDMYTLTDLVHTTGTPLGVCHAAYLAKTDAVNARQVRLVNRRAADNKTAALTLTTVYAGYQYMLVNDPETGAAWTIANVNALQAGVEVV